MIEKSLTMRIQRSTLLIFLLLVFLGSSFPLNSSMAAAKPGGKCPVLNKTITIKSGNTTKQYKCLVDFYGDNVWTLNPKVKSLESSRTSAERLNALNSLGLGKWKQVDNEGFNAQVFMSTWPCRIYIANDLNSAVEIYNDKVNINFYGGFWLGIQSQKWVVDQPSTNDRACVQYFSRKYGGRIYNGNTQSWDNY